MIYKIKFLIILLLISIILSCDGYYNKKNCTNNFNYKIYHYHRKFYEDDYILIIPKELPLEIENIDSIFIFDCDNLKNFQIVIERSNLKDGSWRIKTIKGDRRRNPIHLNDEFIDEKHLFYLNSVFFRTISKYQYSSWYEKDDILLISFTIYDNYEINYKIKTYLKIPFDDWKNIYKYAQLMNKIEIFKVEN